MMEKKIMEERGLLEKRVTELEAILDSEQMHQKQDMEQGNPRLQQNTTVDQAFLNLCKEQQPAERWMRDQEKLEKCVAQLEATLASQQQQHEKNINKIKQALMERKAVHLPNVKLSASVMICEEQQKIAEHRRENLMRDQEQLQKTPQLVANAAAVREQLDHMNQKLKQAMEKMKSAHLQNISEVQASLNLCEECEKNIKIIKQIMKEKKAANLKKITELQKSLKLCEEREKTAELGRESLARDLERLEKHVAELEDTLASEREEYGQQVKKLKLHNRDKSTAILQKISQLQTSLSDREEELTRAHLLRMR